MGVANTPCIAVDDGRLCPATLENLATCCAVGWALEPSITQALTLAARDGTLARHRPPDPSSLLPRESVRGRPYQDRPAWYGLTSSVSRKGNRWGNAGIEVGIVC